MAKKPRTPDTPPLAMLRQITSELAKDIKTEADLNKILNQFVKMTVEAALGAEMEHHLGYAKSATGGRGSGNSRNGFSPKMLTSQYGELAIGTRRDRNSEFDPVIVQKGQTRLTLRDPHKSALINQHHISVGFGEVIKNGAQHRSL